MLLLKSDRTICIQSHDRMYGGAQPIDALSAALTKWLSKGFNRLRFLNFELLGQGRSLD